MGKGGGGGGIRLCLRHACFGCPPVMERVAEARAVCVRVCSYNVHQTICFMLPVGLK